MKEDRENIAKSLPTSRQLEDDEHDPKPCALSQSFTSTYKSPIVPSFSNDDDPDDDGDNELLTYYSDSDSDDEVEAITPIQ